MLSNLELEKVVKTLINYKFEGGYWDFKREWYHDDQKSDLLLDIICMANNLENRDAYIIIGVDEDNDYEVLDITEDQNRKNTQNITDFLHTKVFAGSFVPTVFVRSIVIGSKCVDVIIIKNTTNTPYFLSKRYQDVLDGNIYVRLQNTNTPKDRTAEWPYVEQLWAKHFGLSSSSIDKINLYLRKPEDWVNWPLGKGDNKQYYKYAPEYTIEWFQDNEFDTFYHYKDYSDDDVYAIVLRCHETRLSVFPAIKCDDNGLYMVFPEKYILQRDDGDEQAVYYFVRESLRYAVLEYHFARVNFKTKQSDIECLMNDILVFDTDEEKNGYLETL